MIPVVTPEQMGAIDRAAPEPTDVLVERAAAAVEREALAMLGGTYGRRVVVVAGPGNNGADGRVAARRLAARGVHVVVHDATDAPEALGEVDLVVDAAFGTGFRGEYLAPDPGLAPVLAVDIASGLSGLTGERCGRVHHAERTITFAALKPGLLLGAGPEHSGEVRVADIGLDVSRSRCHLVEAADVAAWVPRRAVDAHKWAHAVWVIAGSPGMSGAAGLCAAAAMRGGAGYVRLSTPSEPTPQAPLEAVVVPLEPDPIAMLSQDGGRFAAFAIGPGLGRSEAVGQLVRDALAAVPSPVVLDGDGLHAIAGDVAGALRSRRAATVLTPHDGEFEALTGSRPAADRIAATRALASSSGATVLLKGPTTVVADPDGDALLVRSGDSRLATAGTGDVLTGLVAAHLALGAPPLHAAAAAAYVHGVAASAGPDRGMVASDLLELLPSFWQRVGS